MIELAFVTCLLAAPTHCQDHSLLFEETNGLFGCMLASQSELARWIQAHPDEHVERWQCRIADKPGRKL